MAEYDIKITLELVSKLLDDLSKNLETKLSKSIVKSFSQVLNAQTKSTGQKKPSTADIKREADIVATSIGRVLKSEASKPSASSSPNNAAVERLLKLIDTTLNKKFTKLISQLPVSGNGNSEDIKTALKTAIKAGFKEAYKATNSNSELAQIHKVLNSLLSSINGIKQPKQIDTSNGAQPKEVVKYLKDLVNTSKENARLNAIIGNLSKTTKQSNAVPGYDKQVVVKLNEILVQLKSVHTGTNQITQKALNATTKDPNKLAKIIADANNTLLRELLTKLHGKTSSTVTKIDDSSELKTLISNIKDLNKNLHSLNVNITADLNLKGLNKEIETVVNDFEKKLSKIKVSVPVDADTKKAEKKVAELTNTGSSKQVTIPVDADVREVTKKLSKITKPRTVDLSAKSEKLEKTLYKLENLILGLSGVVDLGIDDKKVLQTISSLQSKLRAGVNLKIVSSDVNKLFSEVQSKFSKDLDIKTILQIDTNDAVRKIKDYISLTDNLRNNIDAIKKLSSNLVATQLQKLPVDISKKFTSAIKSGNIKDLQGVIANPSFTKGASNDVKKTVESLRKNMQESEVTFSTLVNTFGSMISTSAKQATDTSTSFAGIYKEVADFRTKLKSLLNAKLSEAKSLSTGSGLKKYTNIKSFTSTLGSTGYYKDIQKTGIIKPSQTANTSVKDLNDFIEKSYSNLIDPNVKTQLQRVEVKRRELQRSLSSLQKNILTTLESTLDPAKWQIVKNKSGKAFSTPDTVNSKQSKQWRLQIADVGRMVSELKHSGQSVAPGSTAKDVVDQFKGKVINDITRESTRGEDKSIGLSKGISTWLRYTSKEDIKHWSSLESRTKKSLAEIKDKINTSNTFNPKEISDAIRQSIPIDHLESVFKKTFATSEANRGIESGKVPGSIGYPKAFVRSVAIPAAKITNTGTAIFETAHGSQRALTQFAKFESGLEKLYSKLAKTNTLDISKGDVNRYEEAISKAPINPASIESKNEVTSLATSLLKDLSKTDKPFVKASYQQAVLPKAVQLHDLGYIKDVSKFVSELNTAISKSDLSNVDSFIKTMDKLGLSAYDVSKALDSVKFQNVYDVYDKVLHGQGNVQPLKAVAKNPGWDSVYREFEKSARQVEQLMPIIEPSRPRRGLHQENIVNVLARTSPVFNASDSSYKGPDDQKTLIKDLNVRFNEMYEERKSLEKLLKHEPSNNLIKSRLKSLSLKGKTLSSLGIPESQAGSVENLRGTAKSSGLEEGSNYLKVLSGQHLKMFSESLSGMAPFGSFQQTGRNISNVSNALSSSVDSINKKLKSAGMEELPKNAVGTEFPTLRSSNEQSMIASGRYGRQGYGYNVLAELRNTAKTFEDQVVVSGKLANAVTAITKTLVRPSESGRLKGKGLGFEDKVGSVSEIKTGDIKKVGNILQEVLGMPQKYKGRADKAMITEVKKMISVVRSEEVEVQAAKIAEVFLNQFGRKFTTRYGSKGVSVTSSPPSNFTDVLKQHGAKHIKVMPSGTTTSGLGFAETPKSMGELLSAFIDANKTKLLAATSDNNLSKLKKELITSGNKFIIDIFKDADKGVTVPQDAQAQSAIYDKTKKLLSTLGITLDDGVKGIKQIKDLYSSQFGKSASLFKRQPIDVQISSHGIAKRGLQTEVLEAVMNNIIGSMKGTTVVNNDFTKQVYDKLLGKKGSLFKYSKALGYETSNAQGLTTEAKGVESNASFYSKVYSHPGGKSRQSLVGRKFLQVIEEPTMTEGWSKEAIASGRKGAKLNIPAFAAYSAIFGKDSSLMKEINNKHIVSKKGKILKQVSEADREHWEYIKALLISTKADADLIDQTNKTLGPPVELKNIKSFEKHTGTFNPKDERSLVGTIADTEKFSKSFNLKLPSTKGGYENMYIPAPIARGVYPEPLIAGEYGAKEVTRRLQNIVNTAKKFEETRTKPLDISAVKKSVLSNIAQVSKHLNYIVHREPSPKNLGEVTNVYKAVQQLLPQEDLAGYAKGVYSKNDLTAVKGKISPENRSNILQQKAMQQAVSTYQNKLKALVNKQTDVKSVEHINVSLTGKSVENEALQRSAIALEKAKAAYMNTLSETVLGKSGSVSETLFTRKLPAIMAKAVTAVVDKTKDLDDLSQNLARLSASSISGAESLGLSSLGSLSKEVENIKSGHAKHIKSAKESGVPVLKQTEMGISQTVAEKIPVNFVKKYTSTGKKVNENVNGNLLDMLKYIQSIKNPDLGENQNKNYEKLKSEIKSYIDKELTPYIESIRYPFTGTSSVQPYKAKLMSNAASQTLGQNVLAVPGMPELDFKSLDKVVDKVRGVLTNVLSARETELSKNTPDVDKLSKFNKLITQLNKTISDAIPKYVAHQQKLDFDGDAIEIHSAVTNKARKDIKRHFNVVNKNLMDTASVFRDAFTYDEAKVKTTPPGTTISSMAETFSKKFPQKKGFEFLSKPFITRNLEHISFPDQLKILTEKSKGLSDTGGLSSVLNGLQVALPPKAVKAIDTLKSKLSPESLKSVDIEGAVDEAVKGINSLTDDTLKKVIKTAVKNKLYEEKYKDAIEAQLFKLHTGPEVESLTRIHRMFERKVGFKGGIVSTKPGTMDFARDEQTRMNELLRFSIQKGMDVKHAGERPVAGELVRMLSSGPKGSSQLVSKIKSPSKESPYKDLKLFMDKDVESLKMRLGFLDKSQLKDLAAKYKLKGAPANRKDLTDLLVKALGFEGFLHRLQNLIYTSALEGVMKSVKELPAANREAKLKDFGGNVEKYAKHYLDSELESGKSLNVRKYVTNVQDPLYKFRTGAVSPQERLAAFKVKHPTGIQQAPTSGLGLKHVDQMYQSSFATAKTLAEELSKAYVDKGAGAYSNLVKSSIDNMHNIEDQINTISDSLKNYKPRFKTSTGPDYKELVKGILEPTTQLSGIEKDVIPKGINSKDLRPMNELVKHYSTLAGIPKLEDTTNKDIAFETSASFYKAAKAIVPEKGASKEDFKKQVETFVEKSIEKAQALYQLDKALSVIKDIGGSAAMSAMLPKVAINKSIGLDTERTTVPVGTAFNMTENTSRIPKLGKIKGLGGSGGGTIGGNGLTGFGGSSTIVPVRIEEIKEGLGVFLGTTSSNTNVSSETSFTKKLKSIEDALDASGKTKDTTTEHVYRASGLHGGGEFKRVFPKNYFTPQSLRKSQLKSLISSMDAGSKREENAILSSSAKVGQYIHEKLQRKAKRDYGVPDKDIERFVTMGSAKKGDLITGHIDIVMKDATGKEYPVDIKTVGPGVKKALADAIKNGNTFEKTLETLITKGGKNNKYAAYKLLEVASQLNVYMKAINATTSEAEFYNVQEGGTDKPVVIKFKQDVNKLKKDIEQIKKARKAIKTKGGKFSKASTPEQLKNESTSESPLSGLSDKELNIAIANALTRYNTAIHSVHSGKSYSSGEGINKYAKANIKVPFSIDQDQFFKPGRVFTGGGIKSTFKNLKAMHDAAKLAQLNLGFRYKEELASLDPLLKDAIKKVSVAGPKPAEFQAIAEKYKALMTQKGEDRAAGSAIHKAWKLYRIAQGDYYVKLGDKALADMKLAQGEGTEESKSKGAKAFTTLQSTTSRMQDFVKHVSGTPTDIYTLNRQFFSPAYASAAGVYKTPPELIKKAEGPLGDDKQLLKTFKHIVGDLQGSSKIENPLDKLRDSLKNLTHMDSDLVNLANDADVVKRIGPELAKAWDFSGAAEKVTRLRSALERFSKLNLTDEFGPAQRANLATVIKYLKGIEKSYSTLGSMAHKKGQYGEAGLTPVSRLLSPKEQFALHQSNIQKLRSYYKKPTSKGGPKIGDAQRYVTRVVDSTGHVVRDVAEDFYKYGESVDSAGKKVSVFSEKTTNLTHIMQGSKRGFRGAIERALKWGAASQLVYGGFKHLKDSLDTVSQIEYSIAQLKMVMSPLGTDFDALGQSAINFAKTYGVSITSVLDSMKVFAQQGLSQSEVVNRTKVATIAANVTTLNAKDATEALTASMKVFTSEGTDAMRFLDAWSEVESRHAITAANMADAIKKTASAAANAGVTFDQLNGIVASIGSVTRQTGKQVGTSLRYIFARLATQKAPKELAKIGIPVLTNSGELKSAFGILNQLSKSWDTLTSAQKMNIAQAIGGIRQYNSLLVLMSNWDETLKAIRDSTNSKGSAERKNMQIMKTYTKQIAQTKAAFDELKVTFGKAVLPTFKVALKGARAFAETLSALPGWVKATAGILSVVVAYLAKGANIIDGIKEFFMGAKSHVGALGQALRKEFRTARYELFGKTGTSTAKDLLGLKTVNRLKLKGSDTILKQGKHLKDFHSALGKTAFLLESIGKQYNKFISSTATKTGKGLNTAGNSLIGVGKFLSTSVSAASMLSGHDKGLSATDLMHAARHSGLGYKSVKSELGKSAGLKTVLGKAVGYAGEVAGIGAAGAGVITKEIGHLFGDKLGVTFDKWSKQNAGFMKSVTPLVATLVGLSGAIEAVKDHYINATRSAQDYAKSMYGVKREQETELSNIRSLESTYAGLQTQVVKVNQSRTPKISHRLKELNKYKAPVLVLGSLQKDAATFANKLAESNVSLVAGYDKLGNAILNTSADLGVLLKQFEKSKIRNMAKTEIGVAAKYIKDLTQTTGPEKWKVEMRNLIKEVPVVGEMMAKNISIAPAKALEILTSKLNKLIVAKSRAPMSTALNKDIKKYQSQLDKVRAGFNSTYSDLKKVLTTIPTEGLSKKEIAKLLSSDVLKKGFKLMVDLEPRFRVGHLKKKIKWQDVLGLEVLRKTNKGLTNNLDVTSTLTKARMQSAGVAARTGKALSGDVVLFLDKATKKYHMAGNQAIVKLKKTTDGVYNWFVTYFNTKKLKIEERKFDPEMQKLVDRVFPQKRIEAELQDRLSSFNDFVTGAAAGLEGISAKSFNKNLNLGSRFYSGINTTTLLQGSKGFTPSKGFGVSKFQKNWGKSFQEFFAKPMEKYKRQLAGISKLSLTGLDSKTVSLTNELFENLTKIQGVLKNNQVVLQYRAVLVDLTKTFSDGSRVLQENIATEKTRQALLSPTAGYTKGISSSLESSNLGVQSRNQLSLRQKTLISSPKFRSMATTLQSLSTTRKSYAAQAMSADRAQIAVNSIKKVAKGFGASLTPQEMKNYVETVVKTGSTGVAELKLETHHVAENTAQTVTKLDEILQNIKNPDMANKLISRAKNQSPDKLIGVLESVAAKRNNSLKSGNTNEVISYNTLLNSLSHVLVNKVGIKKGVGIINNDNWGWKKNFKSKEFVQRAFSGLDFKTITEGLKQNLKPETKWFGLKTVAGNPTFSKNVSSIQKLQASNQETPWYTSTGATKAAAAVAIASAFEKAGTSKVVTNIQAKLDQVNKALAAATGAGETKSVKALSFTKGELTKKLQSSKKDATLYGAVSQVAGMKTVILELTKAMGFSESTVKKLGEGSVAAYVAMLLFSKILGTDLSPAAEAFGKTLMDIAKSRATGESSTLQDYKDYRKYTKASDAFMRDYHENTKKYTEGHAFGGAVGGPGGPTSDSILARLSNGEYVINAHSTKKLGNKRLDYINKYGKLPAFAAGGPVQGKTGTSNYSGVPLVELQDKDVNRLQQAIATAVGATLAGYVSNKNQFSAELKTGRSKAIIESNKMSKLILNHLDASDKLLKDLKREQFPASTKVVTEQKSTVLDTEKEADKVKKDIDKMRKYYVDGAKKMAKDMSKIQKEMSKIEIAKKFKEQMLKIKESIASLGAVAKVQEIAASKNTTTIKDVLYSVVPKTMETLFGKMSSSTGLMSGKYQPTTVDYGLRNKANLTPEQLLSYNNKNVNYNKGIVGVLSNFGDKVRNVLEQYKPIDKRGVSFTSPSSWSNLLPTSKELHKMVSASGTTKLATPAIELFKKLDMASQTKDIYSRQLETALTSKSNLEVQRQAGNLSSSDKESYKQLISEIKILTDKIKSANSTIDKLKTVLRPSIIQAKFEQTLTKYKQEEAKSVMANKSSFDINRNYSLSASLNTKLKGFSGSAFSNSTKNMSNQQYLYATGSKSLKNFVVSVSEGQLVYSNLIDRLRNIEKTKLDYVNKLANESGQKDTAAKNKFISIVSTLSNEGIKTKKIISKLGKNLEQVSNTLKLLSSTAGAIRDFKSTLSSIHLNTTVRSQTSGYRSAVNTMYGSNSSTSRQYVSPFDRLQAKMYGGAKLGMFSSPSAIKKASLQRQLLNPGTSTQDLTDVMIKMSLFKKEQVERGKLPNVQFRNENIRKQYEAASNSQLTISRLSKRGGITGNQKKAFGVFTSQSKALFDEMGKNLIDAINSGDFSKYQKNQKSYIQLLENLESKLGKSGVGQDVKALIKQTRGGADPVLTELISSNTYLKSITDILSQNSGLPHNTKGGKNLKGSVLENYKPQGFLQSLAADLTAGGNVGINKFKQYLHPSIKDTLAQNSPLAPFRMVSELQRALGSVFKLGLGKIGMYLHGNSNVPSREENITNLARGRATEIANLIDKRKGFGEDKNLSNVNRHNFIDAQTRYAKMGMYSRNRDESVNPSILGTAGKGIKALTFPIWKPISMLLEGGNLLNMVHKSAAARISAYDKETISGKPPENFKKIVSIFKDYNLSTKGGFEKTLAEQLRLNTKALNRNTVAKDHNSASNLLNQPIHKTIQKKAIGGIVTGPGGPREDKVPAMLSPGEFVIKASSVNKIGHDKLNYINKKGMLPKFAGKILSWFKSFKSKSTGTSQGLSANNKQKFSVINTANILYKRKKEMEAMANGMADGGSVAGKILSWFKSFKNKSTKTSQKLAATNKNKFSAVGIANILYKRKKEMEAMANGMAGGGIAHHTTKTLNSNPSLATKLLRNIKLYKKMLTSGKNAADPDLIRLFFETIDFVGSKHPSFKYHNHQLFADRSKGSLLSSKFLNNLPRPGGHLGLMEALLHNQLKPKHNNELHMADGGSVAGKILSWFKSFKNKSTKTSQKLAATNKNKFSAVGIANILYKRKKEMEAMANGMAGGGMVYTNLTPDGSIAQLDKSTGKYKKLKLTDKHYESVALHSANPLHPNMLHRSVWSDHYFSKKKPGGLHLKDALNRKGLILKQNDRLNEKTFSKFNKIANSDKVNPFEKADRANMVLQALANKNSPPVKHIAAVGYAKKDPTSYGVNKLYQPENIINKALSGGKKTNLSRAVLSNIKLYKKLVASGKTLADPELAKLFFTTKRFARYLMAEKFGNMPLHNNMPFKITGKQIPISSGFFSKLPGAASNMDLIKAMLTDTKTSKNAPLDHKKQLHTGGLVRSDGKYELQSGEMVLPRKFKDGGQVNNAVENFVFSGNSASSKAADSFIAKFEHVVAKLNEVKIKVPNVKIEGADKLTNIQIEGLDRLENVKIDVPRSIDLNTSGLEKSLTSAMSKSSVGADKQAEKLDQIIEKVQNQVSAVKLDNNEGIKLLNTKYSSLEDGVTNVHERINLEVASFRKDINDAKSEFGVGVNTVQQNIDSVKVDMSGLKSEQNYIKTKLYSKV